MINSRYAQYYSIAIGILLLWGGGCSKEDTAADQKHLFERVSPSRTNISFTNELHFKQEFNIYRYRNFYNGGGVALGDINNDGLLDIFFTSNMEDNRLYLNKGGWQFEDISAGAGIQGRRAWSTGVSMADVNGDGWLDIYVANAGIVEGDDRKNELYINNGDSTFTEKAGAYGIDHPGLSIHGTFFDYDGDGDLDLFLINNSYRAIGSFELAQVNRTINNEEGGDRLFENKGDKFVDVSSEAGIISSEIGFALGASVGDVNGDGWPDIYVSNDFFERDYLYINNGNGTFRESLTDQMNSTSAASMGADIADLNGDRYPEIFVTDMLPEEESRLKLNTTFDSWQRYREHVEHGFHHQFTRNTLQLNNRNGTFSEVGRWAGVEATDWSWGANIADFDLDGRKDIFVANGIYKDLTNLDYLAEVSREDMVREIIQEDDVNFKKLIDMIPSSPVSNFAFHNRGNMQFADSSSSWGLATPSFSSGSAYGDLDNDGDLDLVVNNVGRPAFVYRNRADQLRPAHRWLQVDLLGSPPNTFAVGARLTAWKDNRSWTVEQFPVRGFQSTVDHRLHLGLGKAKQLDSLLIRWPSGKQTVLTNVKTNNRIRLSEKDAPESQRVPPLRHNDRGKSLLSDATDKLDIDWKHQENAYIDFERDRLQFHMRSAEGPALCTGDANGDDLEDFYLGGARDQPGSLFIQNKQNEFTKMTPASFTQDAPSEDIDCTFFDANGNGRMDLYVASGSNEFSSSSAALADRLYLNRGSLDYEKSDQALPSWNYETTGTVEAADFDQDGDTDLFVGARLRPFSVGYPDRGYLLENGGDGTFEDVTQKISPDLIDIGMITDAAWQDMNGDGYPELVVVGEWMPVTYFKNNAGRLEQRIANTGLDSTHGWWRSVHIDDLDGNGHADLIVGNYGLNSRFKATKDAPVEMWTGDFNQNGTIQQIISTYKEGDRYPMALRHDLIEEIPGLKKKFPTYQSFAGKTVDEIFSRDQLASAYQGQAYMLGSVIAWNTGSNEKFRVELLPFDAQKSIVYGITAADINSDDTKEVIMGGNQYGVKPEIGNYAASYGTVLSLSSKKGKKMKRLEPERSGFLVEGEVRAIETLALADGRTLFVVARNNDAPKFFILETREH
ncbi:VCBS repeat-containing protein [Fodinibius sediminis]|nr:VCBS repeat-containing protein [Fodinibius sediminis]